MLTTLRRIIQEVAGAQDFREALVIMVQRIRLALDTQACSIFLLDRRRSEFVLMATEGLNPLAVNKVRIPITHGLVG
jgi:phosphotransferase system enzyme I (PtsP)